MRKSETFILEHIRWPTIEKERKGTKNLQKQYNIIKIKIQLSSN